MKISGQQRPLSGIILVREILKELGAVRHVVYGFQAFLRVETFAIGIVTFENVWEPGIGTCSDVRQVEVRNIKVQCFLCLTCDR